MAVMERLKERIENQQEAWDGMEISDWSEWKCFGGGGI